MGEPLSVAALPALLAELVPVHAPAGQLAVHVDGHAADAAAGERTANDGTEIAPDTLFDLASVTKVFTAVAFMRLVESAAVGLDDAVEQLFRGFGGGGTAARRVTWRQLLTHTSGLPPGAPLTEAANPDDARRVALEVAPSAPPGATVTYSDVGFMVLGFAIEALTERSLGDAIRELVTAPLGLQRTAFRPDQSASIAPTEVCPWRGRRLRGEVHDENAAALGGVAGHAGLFGTAREVRRLGEMLLGGGQPVLREATVMDMTREHARDGSMRRGLGVSLWSPDPEASNHPFGPRTFGHTGFTGTELWVDPGPRLVVALLTNKVYRGRDFTDFEGARLNVHSAIVDALGEGEASAGSEASR
jgi:CubicO group peptidase (beta-lactamase class C family)